MFLYVEGEKSTLRKALPHPWVRFKWTLFSFMTQPKTSETLTAFKPVGVAVLSRLLKSVSDNSILSLKTTLNIF